MGGCLVKLTRCDRKVVTKERASISPIFFETSCLCWRLRHIQTRCISWRLIVRPFYQDNFKLDGATHSAHRGTPLSPIKNILFVVVTAWGLLVLGQVLPQEEYYYQSRGTKRPSASFWYFEFCTWTCVRRVARFLDDCWKCGEGKMAQRKIESYVQVFSASNIRETSNMTT